MEATLIGRGATLAIATTLLTACAATAPFGLTISELLSPPSGLTDLALSTGPLTTPFDSRVDHYEATSLNTTDSAQIRVKTRPGSTASIDGVPLPSGTWVPLHASHLDKAAPISIAVTDGAGHAKTYQLATLPADFPAYTVEATSPKPGIICFTANASGRAQPSFLFITDQAGRPVYYKKLPDQGFDLAKNVAPDGAVRYSYIQKEGPQLAGVSTPLGSVRLLDARYEEIDRLMVLPHGDHGALPADIHEFVYLDDQHYILAATHEARVTDVPSQPGQPAVVAASLIQEVEDGQVVFEWDSAAHPEFYANASDGNDFTNATAAYADYMHLNSIAVDPRDQNLIVSFRHQDQVVKLDRHTGEVLWRLGGKSSDFPLSDAQRFSHQHFARMSADGVLSLFDNGNASQATRLLTLTLDEGARKVTRFEALAPESRYSSAMGLFEWLDGDTAFVGWGAKGSTGSDATELTRAGTPTFSLSFEDTAYASYRALKYLAPMP